jgi:hypothetical protein
MMRRRRFHLILILGAAFCASSWAANAPQDKTNLAELKKGIELFESVLNQSLAQTFGGRFETLNQARGVYLPGYGVVFSFEVNLTPVRTRGPFSPAPTAKEEQAERTEEVHRHEKAVNVAEQILGDFGQTFNQLAPGESVTIVIHTVAAHPGKIERSTIVLSAEKKLLEARLSHAINQERFVQKLSKTEY